MHRPGVDYWANTRPSAQLPLVEHIPPRRPASATPGPPSLSQTSTADFYVPSDDTSARVGSAFSSHGHRRGSEVTLSPLHPSVSLSASTTAADAIAASSSPQQDWVAQAAELEETKTQLARLQHCQRQEEERLRRLQAAWTRERVDHANSLATLQASLDRERALRTAAEKERLGAVREGHQLRAALRALLAQPLTRSGGAACTAAAAEMTVPLALYSEARHLLQHCEHTFDELKMLQLKATDAAGLERLRRYDVPVLDGIPPPWPPETPSKALNDKVTTCAASATTPETACDAAAAAPAVFSTPMAVRPSLAEETPTGPEVSALTTVSPDTPCSPSAQNHFSANQLHPIFPHRPVDVNASDGDAWLAGASSSAVGSGVRGGGGGGTRRMLLSPPLVSPSADESHEEPGQQEKASAVEAGWSGPMHEFAHDDYKKEEEAAAPTPEVAAAAAAVTTATPVETTTPTSTTSALTVSTPTQLQPEPGAPLSELEREQIVRNTDRLIRQLSRETVALARSQGIHGSSNIAALCCRRGLDYIDPTFLPVTETLGLASGGGRGYDPEQGVSFVVQWCGRDAFCASGQLPRLLTGDGVDPNALRCGRLGDAGVVAAFAALAEASGAVSSVLASTTSEAEQNGLYAVWLCVQGWWTQVTVDAYLPCLCEPDRTVTLYGCSNVCTHDLWPAVCEKALAKVYGTYQALPHLDAATVLGHLTGGPVECWDWWQRSSDTALDEIEAAINTNARGAGIVLLTTYTTAATLSRGSPRSPEGAVVEERRRAYERLGLQPGTAYRVLAVTDNAEGETLLLLRNWTGNSLPAKVQGNGAAGAAPFVGNHNSDSTADRRGISPLRDDGLSSSMNGPMLRFTSEKDAAALERYINNGSDSSEDGCVWLHYNKDVLPLFNKCHACFDCRRFHDGRFPIHFVGSAPAVPTQLLRVRVRQNSNLYHCNPTQDGTSCPTRLWIGLHQPCSGANGGADSSTCGLPVSWSLKVTLIGQETAPVLYRGSSGCGGAAGPLSHTRPARRPYILSESFMGEPQALPAVWMYLELDPGDVAPLCNSEGEEDDEAMMEFFVVPQMELLTETFTKNHRSHVTSRRPRKGDDDVDEVGTVYDESSSLWSWRGRSSSQLIESSLGTSTTAIVAVLAEHRDSMSLDVVEAPEELRAAIYHDVVDRIDFSECVPLTNRVNCNRGAAAAEGAKPTCVRCQLNGRSLATFSW